MVAWLTDSRRFRHWRAKRHIHYPLEASKPLAIASRYERRSGQGIVRVRRENKDTPSRKLCLDFHLAVPDAV